jgi:hypothetical protein
MSFAELGDFDFDFQEFDFIFAALIEPPGSMTEGQ